MNRAALPLLILMIASPAAAADAAGLQEAFAAVAQAAAPAVVSVRSGESGEKYPPPFGEPEDLFGGFVSPGAAKPSAGGAAPARLFPRAGTGLLISADGHILTSGHITAPGTPVFVTLPGEPAKELEAEVLGTDKTADLALLKIQAAGPLPFLRLGAREEPRAGDWAIALGNSLGMEGSVTVGVVSAPRRILKAPGGADREAVQTDAAINPGNSGGPLLNLKGEVIGLNAASYAPAGAYPGIGFAVPAATAKSFVSGLLKRAE
ncbi:MAG: trypsin-like peptidase domain-containing protein [Elusimicrobiales bacterium]|nr:trypsin-like peptidase domain-containing protein [Elusimicrobiales bacterium]